MVAAVEGAGVVAVVKAWFGEATRRWRREKRRRPARSRLDVVAGAAAADDEGEIATP